MKGELFFYCPILGKRVKISGEFSENNRQQFNMSEKKGFCKVNCGVCSGNCVGCNML